LAVVVVEARDLLPRQAEALHQLDIAQRFRGGAGQRGGLAHDVLLHFLDLAAQHLAQPAEQRHGQQVGRHHAPVHAGGVDDHEYQADQRGEDQVDRHVDQLLHVGPHLLQFAQRLAGALVFEERVGQFQGVAYAIGIEPRAHLLGDQVDEVVLEVLGHARNERHEHRRRQQPVTPRMNCALEYWLYLVA
jgi:hypothetical protein